MQYQMFYYFLIHQNLHLETRTIAAELLLYQFKISKPFIFKGKQKIIP